MAPHNAVKPLFLFSLPRSGSTLLQRVLASSSEVSTVPEPWILLPLLGMRQEGTYAEYGHQPARRAIDEFVDRLDENAEGFDGELRRFVCRL
ncbi:MAG: sulfotransferase, partial [Candidatus Bipolaricaulia bacterium]